MSFIKFLGTAGARFVVMKQLRASGGVWFSVGKTNLYIDPGPGALVRCLSSKPRLEPSTLDGILLTHKHLDHSSDVNVMIEAMTDGGLRKRGALFAPRDAMDEDPVVLHYLRPYLQHIEVLKEGGNYSVGAVSFRTPVRHHHPVETYGIVFNAGEHTISCLVDTRYFDELCQHYRADLLIVNVVRFEPGGTFDHLSAPEAGEIIKNLQPKVAILNHFGMTMWRAKPWEVAKRLAEETGVRVISARDGMKFDLAGLD